MSKSHPKSTRRFGTKRILRRKVKLLIMITLSPSKQAYFEKQQIETRRSIQFADAELSTIKLSPAQKRKDTKVWCCVHCNEPYVSPLAVDWIQCSTCKDWSHELCTRYKGGNFAVCVILHYSVKLYE